MSTKAERRRRIKEQNAGKQLQVIDRKKNSTGGRNIGRHELRKEIHSFNTKQGKALKILSEAGASA